jgi:hypothetical protein
VVTALLEEIAPHCFGLASGCDGKRAVVFCLVYDAMSVWNMLVRLRISELILFICSFISCLSFSFTASLSKVHEIPDVLTGLES